MHTDKAFDPTPAARWDASALRVETGLGDCLRLAFGCSIGLGQCLAVFPGRLAIPLPGTAQGAHPALLWRLRLSTSGDPL